MIVVSAFDGKFESSCIHFKPRTSNNLVVLCFSHVHHSHESDSIQTSCLLVLFMSNFNFQKHNIISCEHFFDQFMSSLGGSLLAHQGENNCPDSEIAKKNPTHH